MMEDDDVDIFKFRPTEDIKFRLMDAVKQDEATLVNDFFKFVKPEKVQWAFELRDNFNRNLLHLAANELSVKALKVLLKYTKMIHYDVDLLDDNKDTPLLLACIARPDDETSNARVEFVKMLITAGARLSMYKLRTTDNPLHWACYHGDKELVEVLNKQQMDEFGSITPLMTHRNQKRMFPFDYLIPDFLEKIDMGNKIWKARGEIAKELIKIYLEDSFDRKKVEEPLRPASRRNNQVNPAVEHLDGLSPAHGSPGAPNAGANEQSNLIINSKVSTPDAAHAAQPGNIIPNQDMVYDVDAPIDIYHNKDVLNSTQKLEHHMLYFCAITGEANSLMAFIRRRISPFRPSFNNHTALQGLVWKENVELLKKVLNQNYSYPFLNGGVIREFNMKEAINISCGEDLSSALHIAVAKNKSKKNEMVKLLCGNEADFEAFNVRGWKPLEMTLDENMAKYEQTLRKAMMKEQISNGTNTISALENYATIYQYAIVTNVKEVIDDNVLFKQLKAIKNRFRSKGNFIIKTLKSYETNEDGSQTIIFLIAVQKDLLTYQATRLSLQTYNLHRRCLLPFDAKFEKEFENLRDHQIQTIIYSLFSEEFDINLYAENKVVSDHFPMHNFLRRKAIWTTFKQNFFATLMAFIGMDLDQSSIAALNALCFYYGAKIAWYFAFYCHYTVWLVFVLIPGVLLQIYIYITPSNSIAGAQNNTLTLLVALYSIFIALWSTVMLEIWKRHQSEIAFIWDMQDFEENEQPRIQYRGTSAVDNITDNIVKYDPFTPKKRSIFTDLPLILVGLTLIVGLFIFMRTMTDKYKNDSTVSTFLGVVNGIIIFVLNEVYIYVARKAVNWENHQFESKREQSYIIKNFIFQFVNSYLTLFDISFVRRDNSLLQSTLISTIMTKTFVQTAKEVGLPWVLYIMRHRQFTSDFEQFKSQRKKRNEEILFETKEVLGDIKEFARLEGGQNDENLYLQEQVEETRIMNVHQDLLDEYTNLAINFGYIAFFSSAFPLAAVVGLVNNIIKMWCELYAFSHTKKRALAVGASDIGFWEGVFTVMSFAAIVVNTLNIFFWNFYVDAANNVDYVYILIIGEHGMLALKYALQSLIPDVPDWVIEAGKQRAYNRENADRMLKLEEEKDKREKGEDKAKGAHSLITKKPSDITDRDDLSEV